MTQTEGRVAAYPEYGSNLGQRLFPRQPTDGFFEHELRSQCAEMLASCIQPGASATVQQLVDFARRYLPQELQDCSPQFRTAVELRWRANQARIIQALTRANESGLEVVTADCTRSQ